MSMTKIHPDKWVRKAVSDAVDNTVVNDVTIKCYDTRVSGAYIPQHYVIMSTQTNTVDPNNKCEWFWESSILLDITTTYDRPGNVGSRVMVDDMCEAVRGLVYNLQLDVASGLEIIKNTISFPNDITTVTDNEIVFRKFLRLELLIK